MRSSVRRRQFSSMPARCVRPMSSRSPRWLAALWRACLVNLTAFPLPGGLLPYIAKDIDGFDQTGLGALIASFALGSLVGSLGLSPAGRALRPARMMILFALGWYAAL